MKIPEQVQRNILFFDKQGYAYTFNSESLEGEEEEHQSDKLFEWQPLDIKIKIPRIKR